MKAVEAQWQSRHYSYIAWQLRGVWTYEHFPCTPTCEVISHTSLIFPGLVTESGLYKDGTWEPDEHETEGQEVTAL